MVEIRYGEHYEVTDLAGKSVAEVREQYKPELGIPDKAKALLNGKQVTKKLEPETLLSEGDELSFEVKQRSRKPLLIGALMLALALTGGLFAFAYTTASITLGSTLWAVGSDFATVNASSTFDWWHVTDDLNEGLLGRVSGAMDDTGQTLFTINPSANYTGDLEIKVYLANAGHMRKAFQHFNMMLECQPSEEYGSANLTYQLLTLQNADVLFHWNQPGDGSSSNVTLVGGSWHTMAYQPLPWPTGYRTSPQLYCEVQPR